MAKKFVVGKFEKIGQQNVAGIQKLLSSAETSMVQVVQQASEQLRVNLVLELGKFELTKDLIIEGTVANIVRGAALNKIVKKSGAAVLKTLTGAQKLSAGVKPTFGFVTPKSWASQRLQRIEQAAFQHARKSSRNIEKFYKGVLKSVDLEEAQTLAKLKTAAPIDVSRLQDKLRFISADREFARERIKQSTHSAARFNSKGAKLARTNRQNARMQEIVNQVDLMTTRTEKQITRIGDKIAQGDASFAEVLGDFNQVDFPSDQARHRTFTQLKASYDEERFEEETSNMTPDQKENALYAHRGPKDSRTTEVSWRYLGRVMTKADWDQVPSNDGDVPDHFNPFVDGLFYGERGFMALLPDEFAQAVGGRKKLVDKSFDDGRKALDKANIPTQDKTRLKAELERDRELTIPRITD